MDFPKSLNIITVEENVLNYYKTNKIDYKTILLVL